MKTLTEIISQPSVFLNMWNSKIEIVSDFYDIHMSDAEYNSEKAPYSNVELWKRKKADMNKALEELEPIHILFASYGCANYSGYAWVLFESDGELWEVHGSHCSCFGLEGQWLPEKVVLPELENRLKKGSFGEDDYSDNVFKSDLASFLGVTL